MDEAPSLCGQPECDCCRYADKRIAELEADVGYVKKKLDEYVASGFDPGMMGPTLDDLRHHFGLSEQGE